MSIDVRVCASTSSVKKKRTSLADFRIEINKNKKCDKTLLTDKIEVPIKQSCELVDKQKSRDCIQKNDIVKEKDKIRLIKYEKRYKYLERSSCEYISPKDNQNKSSLKTNDVKSTKRPKSTLSGLAQKVLDLEREVNAVLSSRPSRQCYDYNSITEDDCETIDFRMKLDEMKNKLLDEFDLNLSNQDSTRDSLCQYENKSTIVDSTADESLQSLSARSSFLDHLNDINIERITTIQSDSSRLDDDQQMINLLTEEILMESSLEVSSDCSSFDENKHINSPNVALLLSDMPKIFPSLLHRKKPPTSLTCKKYKKLNIDFTIHELSAIYEADSDGSRCQTNMASLKS